MTGILGGLAAPARSQAPAAVPGAVPASVSRTTKAVNYRRTGGAAKIDFQGTELLEQASGEAKVQNKGSRVEIEAKFVGLDEATKFGLEYLTYVLWAVSPEGRAVNLGEVVLKGGAGEVKAITDMQTFGMIVTAEPYFAVTQPGNTVVLENVINTSMTRVEDIAASYELVGRGVYSSTNTRIEGAIFGIDRKTPLELFEARNSVRIAHNALADKYAAATLAKAEQQLRAAEEAYAHRSDRKAVAAAAREVVVTAEEARVMAIKQKAEVRVQLLSQLNSILQTRDSARGLIVNMSDVLFDTGSFTLKPGAREKLAKISGILLAHSGLTLQIEGHTDSVGGDEFNQQLSERRADSVRDFLAEQGVPGSSITARGFGKTQPVASNDTPEGRQRNRRVELVVNGDAIGGTASASGSNAASSQR